jgi:ligand-binding sensor domain-containing protein/anti-sigma regulatory factor (Ser/Thr protein kinase)
LSWLRAGIVLALVALSHHAYALDPMRTLTQSVHRIWQVQQGLPQAWIHSIVQTRDGYLWLGTQTGLVKFDGVRFTTIDEIAGTPSARMWVTELLEDDRNALWIGTTQTGLIKLQDGIATRYSQREGLPSGTVQCLFSDRHGNVWACTPNGLAELTGGTVRVFGTADGLSSPDVHAACVAPDGTLLVGAGDDAQLATWNGARFVSRPLPLPNPATVQSMLCGADGTVWIGTSDGLVRSQKGRVDRLTSASGLADNSILTLAETRDGSVLAGTTNGFSRIRGDDVDSFRPQDGLSQSTVYSLYEDREGSLWAATKHGLNQFLDGRAIPYTTSEGLPTNNTGPVLQDRRGIVWVGTLGGGLARFDGHGFAALTKRDGLVSNTIVALAEDNAGDLWVGTDAGLNRLRNGRIAGTWTTRDGLPANAIRALYRDDGGTMWIATTRGPAVFRDGAVRRVPDVRGGPSEAILAFGEDRTHQLYAAPEDDAPALHHADALYRDSEGLLWVGTLGEGLRLVDGNKTVSFSVLDGLFDDVIYGITEDGQGRLWMACSKGIFSVSRADLQQFAAGKIKNFVSTPYSPLDGLRTVECQSGVQPTIAKTKDGRLWFSTIRGVLVIDPEHFDRRLVPPAVIVEDVTVNGERRSAGDMGTLPAGLNNVEFKYTGASFIAPARISFKYTLQGLDNAWVEAGPRREAFYTNLPPGRFRFRVAACTPDGACNESASVVAFAIAPRFYQHSWFFPLCLVGIALTGGAIYQLRIRRLKEHFDLILAERGRIARELHDTLFQGFSGITMAMQAMVPRLPSSSGERQALEDIVADAGYAMREARRSIAGLRRHDASSGLAAAVAQAARQLTETNHVRLKLNLADCPCDLTPDVEYNLLRIAQEAILNAVKHSGARTLRVTLDGTEHHLQLSVKDDGAGFDDSDTAPAGHYGLIGMNERAAQIGAKLHVTSAPGRGTTVSVMMEM